MADPFKAELDPIKENTANSRTTRALWFGGALSGLFAGSLMIVAMMLTTFALGLGFWLPTRMIAASFSESTRSWADFRSF